MWKFHCILKHLGLVKSDASNYMGSRYNVHIEWENGEVTEEPLDIIAKDNPVTCSLYAKENELLDTLG